MNTSTPQAVGFSATESVEEAVADVLRFMEEDGQPAVALLLRQHIAAQSTALQARERDVRTLVEALTVYANMWDDQTGSPSTCARRVLAAIEQEDSNE